MLFQNVLPWILICFCIVYFVHRTINLFWIWIWIWTSLRLTSHIPPVPSASHPNPALDICISPQPRWCLTSIHVPGFLSHVHPGIASPPSRSKNYSLTMIHIVAHIYPGSISPKSRSKCEFHLHPRPISSPSRPIDSHLASIQVVSHLNPGLYIWVPSSSRWRLSSNQVTKIASLCSI